MFFHTYKNGERTRIKWKLRKEYGIIYYFMVAREPVDLTFLSSLGRF